MLFAEPAEALEPLVRRALEFTADQRRRGNDVEPTEVIIGSARCRRVDAPSPMERFAVLQLACSFLPGRDTRIEWARFRVQLQAEREGVAAPIAVDLHPREVHQADESEFGLVLEPRVSFGSADVSLGKAETKIQKLKQIPVTVAAGLQASVFYWQLEYTAEYPLVGTRGFYALVASEPDGGAVVIESSVVADIVTSRGTFRAATREHRDVPPLVQRVCD